jgi:hypothetical protein
VIVRWTRRRWIVRGVCSVGSGVIPQSDSSRENYTERFCCRDDSDSRCSASSSTPKTEILAGQRYIEGTEGDLAAIRSVGVGEETDETVLRLSNPHGDAIATAAWLA